MDVTSGKTIGAHFSILVEEERNTISWSHGYESARSALYALLVTVRPARIWVPYYVCTAVNDAVKAAGVSIVNYELEKNFAPEASVVVGDNDLILLVNYFGLFSEMVDQQLCRFNRSQVVVDCSQAFFDQKFDCLASIYSPRKFLPVPDGGGIVYGGQLPKLSGSNLTSIRRYQCLLGRVADEPEVSRESYLASEHSFDDISLREMSVFTSKLIKSIDASYIAAKRRENYMTLCSLNKLNELAIALNDAVPLCYVFVTDNAAELRQYLTRKRVLTPKFWPDVMPVGSVEKMMDSRAIFIPVDHRYSPSDMQRINSLVVDFLGVRV